MEIEENSVAEELAGIDEFLDRYTNPINKQIYMELFSIFINKEEMDIFNSISEMISSEEQLDSGDVTSIISGLTKRAAIAVLKNTYGIILTEELEIRLVDIHSALTKLRFLIDIDIERAQRFKSIIDEREDDFDAYASLLEDLGIDLDFIYNYITDIDYDFLDVYAKILTEHIERFEPGDEEELENMLKLTSVTNCLKATFNGNKSNLLNLSLSRNTLLKESDVLEVLNSEEFILDTLHFELLSAYKLTMSQNSISEFFKDYTENLTFTDLQEEEKYFVLFQDLESKYKVELAKRMHDE